MVVVVEVPPALGESVRGLQRWLVARFAKALPILAWRACKPVSIDRAFTGIEQAKKRTAEKARMFKYLATMTAVVVFVNNERRGIKKSGRGRGKLVARRMNHIQNFINNGNAGRQWRTGPMIP